MQVTNICIGYVGYKLVTNTVLYEFCCSELITDHVMEISIDVMEISIDVMEINIDVMEISIDDGDDQYSYLPDLDRGGLKWPTDLLVKIVA